MLRPLTTAVERRFMVRTRIPLPSRIDRLLRTRGGQRRNLGGWPTLQACLLASSLSGWSAPSVAAEVVISAVPTTWRLQNYMSSSGLVLWFTGSSCTNGLLTFSNPSEQDKNRLWSLVLAAKLSGKAIFIYYDNAASNCPINSFGMDG